MMGGWPTFERSPRRPPAVEGRGIGFPDTLSPNEIKKQLLFAILLSTMPSDTQASQPSPAERREFYRITVPLAICLQSESDQAEGTLIQRSVNISGGGIGVTLDQTFEVNEILSCTLLLWPSTL
ncbi:MAG: PilZ domain-containing protein [Nitrospira sp.]|nr:PilZ domain-containing protein [Nitrospira sp.]